MSGLSYTILVYRMHHSRALFFFLLVFVVVVIFSSSSLSAADINRALAALFISSGIKEKELKKDYQNKTVNMLIAAGHDDAESGGYYNGLWEADLNLELSEKLFQLFSADPHFRVSRTRTAAGYTADFVRLFDYSDGRVAIDDFRSSVQTAAAKERLRGGIARSTVLAHHPFASPESSLKLYGINKWANEHDIDLVLHVHFNDYPSRPKNAPGTYSGFSVYIPDAQLPNAASSRAIAENVFRSLSRFFAPSNFPSECCGVLEDQDLVAVGAQGSLQSAALLIEYGYIYEPQFYHSSVRTSAMSELAFQTYHGVKRYFYPDYGGPAGAYGSALLPYRWERTMQTGMKYQKDVFALQTALAVGEWYPPKGADFTQCPITGSFGPCTKKAATAFQEAHAAQTLSGASARGTGAVDTQTLKLISSLYGR